jgi:hypothetical protein
MTPASIRNNNPGAQEPGYASKRFGSTSFETLRWKDKTGKARKNKIATFPTPQHGAAACFHLLGTSKHYVGQPISKAITTWCGGYSASGYAKALQSRAGLSGDTILTADLIRDPSFAVPLLMAMAKWEAGREFPMDEAGFRQGHDMAFGDGLAPAPSPDNDVPAQKPEGKAREVIATAAKVAGGISVPAVPAAYTTAVGNIQGWQSLGDQIVGLAKWAVISPLALLIIAGTAALLFLPKMIGGRA